MDNNKKRIIAESLYINEGFTAKEISDILEISVQSISAWKKGRENEKSWDDRRQDNNSAPHRIKEALYSEMASILEGNEPTISADAVVKLSKAIDYMDKKINIPTISTVFKNFNTWLVEHEPQLAIETSKQHLRYLRYISESELP